MKKKLLIIFVKNPVLGKAKTRLAATIGDANALEIYKLLLKRTVEITTELSCDKVVFYSEFIDNQDVWDNDVYRKRIQVDGDLGEKMSKAIEQEFDSGYESICIIGSDCYDLDSKIINSAFEILEEKDVVIGESEDGGYYLLGMNKLNPAFFENKNWSTETVATDTIDDFRKGNLTFGKLPVLNDIDEEKDLRAIQVLLDVL